MCELELSQKDINEMSANDILDIEETFLEGISRSDNDMCHLMWIRIKIGEELEKFRREIALRNLVVFCNTGAYP